MVMIVKNNSTYPNQFLCYHIIYMLNIC